MSFSCWLVVFFFFHVTWMNPLFNMAVQLHCPISVAYVYQIYACTLFINCHHPCWEKKIKLIIFCNMSNWLRIIYCNNSFSPTLPFIISHITVYVPVYYWAFCSTLWLPNNATVFSLLQQPTSLSHWSTISFILTMHCFSPSSHFFINLNQHVILYLHVNKKQKPWSMISSIHAM